ncbi:MAG: hypothetical protein R2856_23210 [Caldilineaceae bacterium]
MKLKQPFAASADDVEFAYIDDIRAAVNQSTSMTIDGHQNRRPHRPHVGRRALRCHRGRDRTDKVNPCASSTPTTIPTGIATI